MNIIKIKPEVQVMNHKYSESFAEQHLRRITKIKIILKN